MENLFLLFFEGPDNVFQGLVFDFIPAVLGSHEAIQVFAFGSLGLGAPAATAFTMIIRAADILVALIGTAALFQLGIGILKKYLR